MASPTQPGLVRAIGRWTLAALVLNSIIGSGIFGQPRDIARYLGTQAPWAYLLAAAGIGIIMACFAEVASQFSEAGGPYLYAREAFGRFVGVQMGWFAWLVRLTSAAANANLFVIYLGQFWPEVTTRMPRAVVLTVLLMALAAVNIRGVKAGAQLSNVFTIGKLVPLGGFIVIGLFLLPWHAPAEAALRGNNEWLMALLALMFAYGGFEAALMPMGEAKNPRKDAPFALFAALTVCAVVYTLVHVVVMFALPDASASDRPLAAAAQVFLGSGGAALISIGAMLSTYGYLSGQMVSAPRLTFAFAERRDFPALFARVHPVFRTPYVSIVVYAILVWALALYGSFTWNAILSAVARLFTYGTVCGALMMLRVRRPGADAFRLPLGWLFAVLGIAFCLLLVMQMDQNHLKIVVTVVSVAALNWAVNFLLDRRRGRS